MKSPLQMSLFPEIVTSRQFNIIRSPKQNGAARIDSLPYLKELGIEIINDPQPIQFLPNSSELVHRWSPYVQGFSAKFVQRTLDLYKRQYDSPVVLDPFAGSGTVIVQSKLNNYEVYGIELNPLLHFIAETKINSWQTNPENLMSAAKSLQKTRTFDAPEFLKNKKHFNPGVLLNLERIKSGIDSFKLSTENDKKINDLLLLAFSSILINCSKLKRTPCLGYSDSKKVEDNTPFILFDQKVKEISDDLQVLQSHYGNVNRPSKVYCANSMNFNHNTRYDLIITSPPYMNGLDYVMNYKIEMGWLGFAVSHKQLKHIKDNMVVCDNVSKGLIRNFSSDTKRYTNEWLEEIKRNISDNIAKRGSYRRNDMPEIVHKYFDDMHKVMANVVDSLNKGGRFILVVGDSLIADVYLPTDLLLARIGKELGLTIERIEKARNRHSGQIRSYRLRETIVTLRKD